ncbi:MAG: ROK family transcriptional regulator, partial [Sedimentisphaerales bacterium]|nr:ROK family transcriptional regulator [Sedimentisphaerales bacterium]
MIKGELIQSFIMSEGTIDSRSAGQRNERLVLSLLRTHGELSQAQLCRLANFNSSTASYITGRLREKGLIIERPGSSTKRGAKPTIVGINPQGCFIVAVEINPSRIRVGLFDFMGQLVHSVCPVTAGKSSPDDVIILLRQTLDQLLQNQQISPEKLLGLGVTISGTVAPDGTVKLSSPMGWKNVPFRHMLQQYFETPIRVTGTRVRLLAEIDLHEDNHFRNVLYLNVANGVGGSVLIDGYLPHGATDRMGELGHVVVEPDGPPCGCGQHGCLEALVSGPALARRIRSDIAQGIPTSLTSRISSTDVPEQVIEKWGQAILQGDDYARKLADTVT